MRFVHNLEISRTFLRTFLTLKGNFEIGSAIQIHDFELSNMFLKSNANWYNEIFLYFYRTWLIFNKNFLVTLPLATKHVLIQGLKSGAVVHPDGHEKIWDSQHRYSDRTPIGAIFKLTTTKSDFECIGNAIGSYGLLAPKYENYCCVHKNYLTEAKSELLWNTVGTEFEVDDEVVSLYNIMRKEGDAQGVLGGNFIALAGHGEKIRASRPDFFGTFVQNLPKLEVEKI